MMARRFPDPLGVVLFDLGDTLTGATPDLAAAANKVRTNHGLESVDYEVLRPVASYGARGLIGVAFGVGPGNTEFETLRLAFLVNYEAEICAHTQLFPGMADVLAELDRAGIPWEIVTSKSGRLTVSLIAQLPLPVAPACVIAGDTTPYAKPHPAPLLHVAGSIGVDARQIVYVSDDLRDAEAGRVAGMPTTAASYGYCGNGPSPVEWRADTLVANTAELIPLLLESKRV